jgi:uncharacterized protein (DUF433 family)
MATATLDWSQCPVVESVPGRRSGAWIFKDTRMPVATVFENLEVGSSIEEIIEQYDVTRERIQAMLEFAARSLGEIAIQVFIAKEFRAVLQRIFAPAFMMTPCTWVRFQYSRHHGMS